MPEIGQAWIDGLFERKDRIGPALMNFIYTEESVELVSAVSGLVGYIDSIKDMRSDNATTQKEI